MSDRLALRYGLVLSLGLLLSACASKPAAPPQVQNEAQPVSEAQPAPEPASSTGSAADFTNEKTPTNSDSLEVGTVVKPSVKATVNEKNIITIGNPEAPVTLRFFTDFDCEYCRQFVLTQLPWIEDQYIIPGKLKVEQIVVPMSPAGEYMARAVFCGARNGKLLQFEEALSATPMTSEEELAPFLKTQLLNRKSFIGCLHSDLTQKLLAAQAPIAQEANLERVPFFVLGNQSWIGLKTNEEMKQAIEDALQNQ